eukprot:scaffold241832_cov29-Tisochrysis_lutea.AAC.1
MLVHDATDEAAEEGREDPGSVTPSVQPASDRDRLAPELGREELYDPCRWWLGRPASFGLMMLSPWAALRPLVVPPGAESTSADPGREPTLTYRFAGRLRAPPVAAGIGTTFAAASADSSGTVSDRLDPEPDDSCEPLESGVGRMPIGVRAASGEWLFIDGRSATCGLCGGVEEREWRPRSEWRLPLEYPCDSTSASTVSPPEVESLDELQPLPSERPSKSSGGSEARERRSFVASASAVCFTRSC